MDKSPSGREILRRLRADRFVPVESQAYDSIRQMIATVGLKFEQ